MELLDENKIMWKYYNPYSIWLSRIMSKNYQTSMCMILAREKNVHIILLNPNIFNHLEIYFVF